MGGNSSRSSEQRESHANEERADASKSSPAGSKREPPSSEECTPLHSGPIHCLCPVGHDSMLSGGIDKDVILYHWRSHCHLAKFQGPMKDVTKVCYNNKAKCVYAASRDRSLYLWKWPREELECNSSNSNLSEQVSELPVTVLHGHTLGVTALHSCNEFPQLLCSGSRDNSVCLWDLDVGKPVSSMYAPRNVVTDLKWIIGEKSVVQSSEDKTLRVWDLTSCSTVQHFRARNYLQTCCEVSSNRQQFIAGSAGSGAANNSGGELTLWDRRNEKKPLKEFKGHSEGVESCMFYSHQDLKLVSSVGRDSIIRLWELDSGQELSCNHITASGPLTDLVSPEEGILACSSFTGGISIWSLASAADKSFNFTLKSKYM